MHDPRHLLSLGATSREQLRRRGYQLDTDFLASLISRRGEIIAALNKLRARDNPRASASAPACEAAGLAGREQARRVREETQRLAESGREAEAQLTEMLLAIPNLPAAGIPDGKDERDAVEVRRVGEPRSYDFTPRHHADIGQRTGIFDQRLAAKLSGARFRVARGAGARLERALADFFLDLHTSEHGYTEYAVPTLVSRQTMTGTGQLPKFEEDLFRTAVADREMFLIPTAEVPLTNLFAGETIDASALPLAVTAHTPCFRAEAGSYGRDARGLVRLHEFSKVELVRICDPEQAESELAKLVGHAEECLRRLGLVYRVVLLPAGDLGFSARITYDIEVWLPGQRTYREISSCSDCGTFQARRAGIKFRQAGRKQFAATLNGSGLPIGRTLVAITEQYQRADGGIDIPESLIPYTGFRRISPDGAPIG